MESTQDKAMPSIADSVPFELWAKILASDHCDLQRDDFKRLCLVSGMFRAVCQPIFFSSLSASPMVTWSTGYATGGKGVDAELAMERWKGEMARVIRPRRIFELIGAHPTLSACPTSLTIHGFVESISHDMVSSLQPPLVYHSRLPLLDAFLALDQTLISQFPHFTRLQTLELLGYPVSSRLLDAMRSHPRLHDLAVDSSCDIPPEAASLPNIRTMRVSSSTTQHLDSTLNLISQNHIISLTITASFRIIADMFERFDRETTGFPALETLRLKIASDASDALPGRVALISRFLARTPTLRDLAIKGQGSWQFLDGAPEMLLLPGALLTIVTHQLNPGTTVKLASVRCPLNWARCLVPGRPVHTVMLNVHGHLWATTPFYDTVPEIHACLYPLSLSTVAITTLHFHPRALAPIVHLSPFIAEHFPALRDLSLPVSPLDPIHSVGYRRVFSFAGHYKRSPAPRNVEQDKALPEEMVAQLVEQVTREVEEDLIGEGKQYPGASSRMHSAGKARQNIESDGYPEEVYEEYFDDNSWYTEERDHWDARHAEASMGPIRSTTEYMGALAQFAEGQLPLPPALEQLTLMPYYPKKPAFPKDRDVKLASFLASVGEEMMKMYPSLLYVDFVGSKNSSKVFRRPG